MATLRLTARTVEAARPPAAGRLEPFDADLPGFCIRITPNGRRTACVFYRFGPRLRRATLGTLPPLTLADARQLAREALHSAALGEDPASAKRSAREAITVAKLVRDYIAAGEGRRSDATNGDYRRTLKGVVEESPLGHQAARQVARGELRAFLEGIARKAPIRANRVLALVRAAFRWGLREELIERDPTAGLQRLQPPARDPLRAGRVVELRRDPRDGRREARRGRRLREAVRRVANDEREATGLPQALSRNRSPGQLAFGSDAPDIVRARSRFEAPSARSERIRRSIETDGSLLSIFATRDWLE